MAEVAIRKSGRFHLKTFHSLQGISDFNYSQKMFLSISKLKLMQKIKGTLLLLFLTFHNLYSQDSLLISLLTVDKGDQLYTAFGHTALRVNNISKKTDLVYNYGMFDFTEHNFVYKFCKGDMEYFTAAYDYSLFLQDCKTEKRNITELCLDINTKEKIKILMLLNESLLKENMYYTYKQFDQNCATKVRDILFKIEGLQLSQSIILQKSSTFRMSAIQCIPQMPWTRFAINLLLGRRTDYSLTDTTCLFLPEYLGEFIQNSSINSKPIVISSNFLHFRQNEKESNSAIIDYPLYFFWMVLIVIMILQYYNRPLIRKVLYFFDSCLFSIIGLIGILLLYMWFGTFHNECKDNLNILWVMPLHIVYAYFSTSKKVFWKWYRIFNIAILILLLAFHNCFLQKFDMATFPIWLILVFRLISHQFSDKKYQKK